MKALRAMVFCSLASGAVTVWAHHSIANFNATQTVEFRATVTKFEYTNPHSHLYLERTTPAGAKEEWVVEMGSIPTLKPTGISPEKLKAGDVITFRGSPDRNPAKKYVLFSKVTKEDGTEFRRDFAAGTPRTAEVPKGPGSTDFTGTWSSVGGGSGRGFFDPVNYAVTDAGKALLASYREENDPVLNCEKHGLPRSIYGVYPRTVSRNGNTLEWHYEFMDVRRTIHLDQKTHPANGKRTYVGHSIGWFEGNTLVVDTANFAPQKWGNGRGLDSSEQKHMIERYTLADNGHTMNVTFTVTDPVYLTKPAVETHKFRYTPEYKISDFECDVKSAQTFVEEAKK